MPVTGPEGSAADPDTRAGDQPGRGGPPTATGRGTGLAGAAGLIAILTTASRLAGFARIFVFASLIGIGALGNVYQTVNTLPNIVFEIVAGGALASVVVPLLSAAIVRGDSAAVNRISSALLTWTVTVLVPLSVLVAVLARPIVTWALDGRVSAEAVEVGVRMLLVFAPQLVLYGVGIVLTGVLQAHHRFAGPALAPLLSSVTVMISYALFASIADGAEAEDLTLPAELVLSVGTTFGVAVLSLCLLVPLRRTGVRLRATYRFPEGVARRVRTLVGAGVAAVAGQQLALLVVLKLSQPTTGVPEGALVAYTLAQTLFFLPWAVLAVPVATSAFPRLVAAHAAGDHDAFRRTLGASARAVLLLCAAAAAALVAAARPVAEVVVHFSAGDPRTDPAALAWAIAAFGPGVIGYGLLALLSRALYAAGGARSAAVVTTAGWAVVIVADVAFALTLPAEHRVAALAAGHTLGMTVLGVALLLLTRARIGALVGVARAATVGLLAAVCAAGAGLGVTAVLPGSGVVGWLGQGMLVGVVVLIVFGGAAALGNPVDVRPLLRRTAGRLRKAGKSNNSGSAPTEGDRT